MYRIAQEPQRECPHCDQYHTETLCPNVDLADLWLPKKKEIPVYKPTPRDTQPLYRTHRRSWGTRVAGVVGTDKAQGVIVVLFFLLVVAAFVGSILGGIAERQSCLNRGGHWNCSEHQTSHYVTDQDGNGHWQDDVEEQCSCSR